jgi:hypothetical protein
MASKEQKSRSPTYFFDFAKHMTTLSTSLLVIVAGFVNVPDDNALSTTNAFSIQLFSKVVLVLVFFTLIATIFSSVYLMSMVAVDDIEGKDFDFQLDRIRVYRIFVAGTILFFMVALFLLSSSAVYFALY